jgi:hypothetical protein
MNFTPKNDEKYCCENCDYKCYKSSDWKRHIATSKHQNGAFLNMLEQKSAKAKQQLKCKICNKVYKARNSLWYHENKCKVVPEIKEPTLGEVFAQNDTKQLTELVLKVVEQNQELTKQIMELAKTSHIQNNTNNINSNNKFNLNVFLNEQCKDALSISEFVSSLVVTVKDLEETAKLGYSEGISKIFLDGLQNLDTRKRPIHCSDQKREVFYIKENDQWIKDNENNDKIINAIKHVAHKNIKMIPEWIKENPDYNDVSSKTNDKYLKLVMNSMSGSTEEEQKKNIGKIISNIAKGAVINKP